MHQTHRYPRQMVDNHVETAATPLHEESVHIVHVHNDSFDGQFVSRRAPIASLSTLNSGVAKGMNAQTFQDTLIKANSSSEKGNKYKREGCMKEALDCYREALQQYKLCHAYFTDSYMNSNAINEDNHSRMEEQKTPPISLELNIALTLQIMATFHDHGLSEAPSAVEAHEITIDFLMKNIEGNHDLDSYDFHSKVEISPRKLRRIKTPKPRTPTSVLTDLGTAHEPSFQLYNVIILNQHERIRLISTSLNALAKIYFEEEQAKSEIDKNLEDAVNPLRYHQEALNFLHKVYPLSTSSLSALGDEEFKRATTGRGSFKPESKVGTRFNIDLRIDIGHTLMQMGSLLCFRGKYEKAAEYFEKALSIREELHKSHDEKEVLETCYALGVAYENCGEYDMATKSYDIVLGSIKKSSGYDTIVVARLCCHKCRILWLQRDFAGSLSWNARAIKIYRENIPRYESGILEELIEALKQRSELFVDMKDTDNAILSYCETMKMQKSFLGPDHPDVAHTLLLLGELYLCTKAFADGRKVLMEALNLFSKNGIGANDPGLRLARIKIEKANKLEEEEIKVRKTKESSSKYVQRDITNSNTHARARINADRIIMSEGRMKTKVTHAVSNKSIQGQHIGEESDSTKHNIALEKKNSSVFTLKGGEIATKSHGYEEDDGVSQLTSFDNEGSTSWKNRRKMEGRQQVVDIGDSLITSYVSEVVNKIADATENMLNGSDCRKHLQTDILSIQSEEKNNAIEPNLLGMPHHTQTTTYNESDFHRDLLSNNMSLQGEEKNYVAVKMNDNDTIESTLLGTRLVDDHTQATTDRTIDESLLGVGLVSLHHENESQIDVKTADHEGGIMCANMDTLMAQMNVVTCEMESGSQGKPFKEMLQVEKKNDKSGNVGSPSKSFIKKKHALEKKIKTHHDLLLQSRRLLGKGHPKVLDIMLNLANLYSRNKEHSKAIHFYLDVQAIQIEKLGENSKEVASTYIKVGDLYLAQNDFDLAMQNYVKARDIHMNIFGDTHPIVASTLNSMGLAELKRGDFDVAMDYLQHALRIQHVHLAPNEHNPDVSQTLVNIGAVYYKERNSFSKVRNKEDTYKGFIESGMLGRIAFAHGERGEYVMAMHFYNEVLQLLRHRGEERSLAGIVMTHNCLGNLNTKTGCYMAAMDCHNKALNALQKSHDQEANEIDFADTQVYLGVVHYHSGNISYALSTFRKVRPEQIRLHGSSPRIARTMYHEGVVNYIMCQYDEAMKILDEALKMQLEILQKNHPDTLNTCLAIGVVNLKLDRFDTALAQFEEVLECQKTIFGENHPDLVHTFNCLGYVQTKRGEEKVAMKMLMKSYKLGLKLLGEEHPFVATTLLRIGELSEQAGIHAKALKSYKECLRIRTECLGNQHYEVAFAQIQLGELFSKMRRFDDAISKFAEARSIIAQSLGEKHLFLASIHVGMGGVFLRRCHFEEAKSEFVIALEMYQKSDLPENHSIIQEIKKDMARVDLEESLCV